MDTANQNQSAQSNYCAVRSWKASELMTGEFVALPLETKVSVLGEVVSRLGAQLSDEQKKARVANSELNTLRKQLATHTHAQSGAAVVPLAEPMPSFMYTVNIPTNE